MPFPLRFRLVLVAPDGAALAEIAALVDQGLLRVPLSEVLPMERMPEAHVQIATGHTRGKIALSWSA